MTYAEHQRLRSRALWAMLLALPLLCLIALALLRVLPLSPPTRANLTSTVTVLFFAPGCLLPAVFVAVRLTTRVDASGITLRWLGGRRFVPMARVRGWRRRDVLPKVKLGSRNLLTNTQLFLMGSRQAMEVELVDGQILLIGTQDADRLTAALAECKAQPDQSTPAAPGA